MYTSMWINPRLSSPFYRFQSDGLSHTYSYNKNGIVHFVFSWVVSQNFNQNDVFMSLKIVFILAYNADPGEMLPYAAFHLGLLCLPSYPFR